MLSNSINTEPFYTIIQSNNQHTNKLTPQFLFSRHDNINIDQSFKFFHLIQHIISHLVILILRKILITITQIKYLNNLWCSRGCCCHSKCLHIYVHLISLQTFNSRKGESCCSCCCLVVHANIVLAYHSMNASLCS